MLYEVITTCFDADRLASGIDFGASLLYGKRDGLTRKVYYGHTAALQPEERHCLSNALIGLSAGAPPDRNTIVEHIV